MALFGNSNRVDVTQDRRNGWTLEEVGKRVVIVAGVLAATLIAGVIVINLLTASGNIECCPIKCVKPIKGKCSFTLEFNGGSRRGGFEEDYEEPCSSPPCYYGFGPSPALKLRPCPIGPAADCCSESTAVSGAARKKPVYCRPEFNPACGSIAGQRLHRHTSPENLFSECTQCP